MKVNPTYSQFLTELTNELISIKGSSVNSVINNGYFIFYVNSIQLSQFKLSLYDQLLKYNTYDGVNGVYDYFKSYILGFIGGGGADRPSGSSAPPPPPPYKIQSKIIIG